MEWREIVDRPASEEEAQAVLNGVLNGRIARLEEMIALYEEIADEEAVERAAAASFDPEAEAVRKRQSTLTRELRQLIELILKMQAARGRRASRDGDQEGEAPAGRACTVPPRDDNPSREPGRPPARQGTCPPGIANADSGTRPRLSSADHAARRDNGSKRTREGKRRGRRTDPDAKSMEMLLAGELSKLMLEVQEPVGKDTGPPDGMPRTAEGGGSATSQTTEGAESVQEQGEKLAIEANAENDVSHVQNSRSIPWRGPRAVANEPDSLNGPVSPREAASG
jgi:hypothetical protein